MRAPFPARPDRAARSGRSRASPSRPLLSVRLRWKAPQPVAHWDGVRKAEEVRATLHAGRPRQPAAGAERGLSVSERLDRGEVGRRTPAGHDLHLRRLVHGRLGLRAAVRRRGAGEERRGRHHLQLSTRSVRLVGASGTDQGIGTQRLRQSGSGRRHRRAAVGAEKCCRLRRRSATRHHLRRIGRRHHRGRPGGIAAKPRGCSSGPFPKARAGWEPGWCRRRHWRRRKPRP